MYNPYYTQDQLNEIAIRLFPSEYTPIIVLSNHQEPKRHFPNKLAKIVSEFYTPQKQQI
jgi:hypothetical protein